MLGNVHFDEHDQRPETLAKSWYDQVHVSKLKDQICFKQIMNAKFQIFKKPQPYIKYTLCVGLP